MPLSTYLYIVTIKKPYLYRPPFLRKKENIIIEAWSILFTENFFVAFYQLVASFSYKVTLKAAQIEKFKLKWVRLKHFKQFDHSIKCHQKTCCWKCNRVTKKSLKDLIWLMFWGLHQIEMQFWKMKGLKNIIDDRFISGPLSFGLSGSLGAPAFEVCTLNLGQWKKYRMKEVHSYN